MRFVDEQGLSRHLVRSEPGEDLLAALAALATSQRWRRALVIGAGVLDLVEVRDPEGELHTLEHAELVALSGTVTAEGSRAVVMLLGTMISGAQLVSGRLVEAVAGDMLLRIDGVVTTTPAIPNESSPPAPPATTVDTEPPAARRPANLTPAKAARPMLELEPEPMPKPMPEPTPEPMPEPTPAPRAASAAPGPATAAARVGVSEPPPLSAPKPPSQTFRTRPIPRRIPSRPHAEWDEVSPEAGDYLQHPQLGLCRVEGPDNRGGTLIIVPSGRRRTLQLDALKVLPAEEDDEGRMVHRILGPRR